MFRSAVADNLDAAPGRRLVARNRRARHGQQRVRVDATAVTRRLGVADRRPDKSQKVGVGPAAKRRDRATVAGARLAVFDDDVDELDLAVAARDPAVPRDHAAVAQGEVLDAAGRDEGAEVEDSVVQLRGVDNRARRAFTDDRHVVVDVDVTDGGGWRPAVARQHVRPRGQVDQVRPDLRVVRRDDRLPQRAVVRQTPVRHGIIEPRHRELERRRRLAIAQGEHRHRDKRKRENGDRRRQGVGADGHEATLSRRIAAGQTNDAIASGRGQSAVPMSAHGSSCAPGGRPAA